MYYAIVCFSRKVETQANAGAMLIEYAYPVEHKELNIKKEKEHERLGKRFFFFNYQYLIIPPFHGIYFCYTVILLEDFMDNFLFNFDTQPLVAEYDEKNSWYFINTDDFGKVLFWTDCHEDYFELIVSTIDDFGNPKPWPIVCQHAIIWNPWRLPKLMDFDVSKCVLRCDRIFNDKEYGGDISLYTHLPMLYWCAFFPPVIFKGDFNAGRWLDMLGVSDEEWERKKEEGHELLTLIEQSNAEREEESSEEIREQIDKTNEEWDEWEQKQDEQE